MKNDERDILRRFFDLYDPVEPLSLGDEDDDAAIVRKVEALCREENKKKGYKK